MKNYRKWIFTSTAILLVIILCLLFASKKSYATFQTSFEYNIKDADQKSSPNNDISHFMDALKQSIEVNLTTAKTLYKSIDFTELLKEGKPHVVTCQNANILVYNNGKKVYIYSFTMTPSVTYAFYDEPVVETTGVRSSNASNMGEGSSQLTITGEYVKKILFRIGMEFKKGDSIVADWNKKNNTLDLSENQTSLLKPQGLAVEMKTNEMDAYLLKNTVKIPNEVEKNFKSKDSSGSASQYFVLPTVSSTNDNYSLNEYTFDKGRKTSIYNSVLKADALDYMQVVSEFVFSNIRQSKANVAYWIRYTY